MGRKTKYEKDFPERAERFMEEGHTEAELAKNLCVSEQTLNEYKKKYPEFLEALKRGKIQIDDDVECALLKRANGYEFEELHREYNKDGELIRERRIIKEVVPDVTAQIFWLKNRRPEDWRDKKEINGSLEINVTLDD